jgi:hypothetical protein
VAWSLLAQILAFSSFMRQVGSVEQIWTPPRPEFAFLESFVVYPVFLYPSGRRVRFSWFFGFHNSSFLIFAFP